jgi:nitrogen fixation/metabolism regulation signal transduction histidine kinase
MKSEAPAAGLRHRGWWLVVGLTILLSMALVLLFLLTQATQRWEAYEQNFALLFGLNMVFAALLLAVIAWFGVRLFYRLRQGKFGSRLLVKLASIFALVGILPGLLIYAVSYQFVTRSIEVWFDTKVEVALDAGLNLSRSTLESLSNELATSVRNASQEVAGASNQSLPLVLEKIRIQLDANEVTLWQGSGVTLASASQEQYQLQPERPTPAEWRQVRSQGISWRSEGLDDNLVASAIQPRITVLVQIAGAGFQLDGQGRVLQVVKKLPPVLVANALAVLDANRQYQERALARDGLKRMYIGTLTLSLFLAVFGAVLLAVLLGNQLARPLLLLAEGVRDVAAGDLSPRAVLQGKDELDGLTRAFAQMTEQLAQARRTVESSMAQVNLARSHLQTMLDNLTAGVVLLDTQGHILSINPGATRILQLPLAVHLGKTLTDIEGLQLFGRQVMEQFHEFASEQQRSLDHWQQSFEIDTKTQQNFVEFGPDRQLHTTLVARGAVLPQGEWLLVFDDITEIVSAQRTQAWSEVARRLAHEIKNPLTPIQLSAERLGMKLADKLVGTDQTLLHKSVKTIVDQVDALQRLVNEFRDFGRLPQARLQALDLNHLLQEMMPLYDNDNALVPVSWHLNADIPLVSGDAAQLRQVVHNLIQNAQDASAQSTQPMVHVWTEQAATSQRVRLRIVDNGIGFSDSVLQRAFEPYVTTKAGGTGLGLAVVKKIADEHQARIEIKNRLEGDETVGAQVSLSFRIANPAS